MIFIILKSKPMIFFKYLTLNSYNTHGRCSNPTLNMNKKIFYFIFLIYLLIKIKYVKFLFITAIVPDNTN